MQRTHRRSTAKKLFCENKLSKTRAAMTPCLHRLASGSGCKQSTINAAITSPPSRVFIFAPSHSRANTHRQENTQLGMKAQWESNSESGPGQHPCLVDIVAPSCELFSSVIW